MPEPRRTADLPTATTLLQAGLFDHEPQVLGIATAGLLHGLLACLITMVGPDGRPTIRYANDAFLRLSGLALTDVLGRTLDLLRGADTTAESAAALDQALLAALPGDVELLHYRGCGTPFWNGITIAPVIDPDQPAGCALVLMRDVTARHRADEKVAAMADRLHALAMSDPLTGVANRRHFDAVLARAWRRARQQGSDISLAMIDIDHFKSYNDHHGHPAGDSCLRMVARALEAAVRQPADFVARYGGEEFAILMPELDAATAGEVADRLVQAIRDLAIAHPCQETGLVSISCGVATCRPQLIAGDAARLIEQADRALYLAKAGGRNRMHRTG